MVTALAIIGVVALVAGGAVANRRYEERRLARPALSGVCLPAVDDHRWRASGGYGGGYVIGRFHVWPDGDVHFDSTSLGYWRAYEKRIVAGMRRRLLDDVATQALDELENAK